MNYSDIVTKGAQSLDTFVGKVSWLTSDWREKINLDMLQMSSLTFCILGQLHPTGDYDDAIYDLRQVDSNFDSYPFGSFTEEWKTYLLDSSKFAVGSKWVNKNDKTYTMTVQGAVSVEGKGKCIVYLTSEGSVYVRSADAIQRTWDASTPIPTFEFGQEIVFPQGAFGGGKFYYIGNKSDNGVDMLLIGKDTFVMTKLKEYAAYYGTPKVGTGNRSYHLAKLRAAMTDN